MGLNVIFNWIQVSQIYWKKSSLCSLVAFVSFQRKQKQIWYSRCFIFILLLIKTFPEDVVNVSVGR